MELNDYLPVLSAQASMLAAAASEAGLDAPVPTCPGWSIRDLLLHIGEVHRWAAATVESRAVKLSDVPADFLGDLPADEAAIEWFRAGAQRLSAALSAADVGVEYAAFLNDPPSPRLLFWARRQTMETAMHRVDAESAVGRCTPLDPRIAVDGIDEFLCGFLPRSRTALHSNEARTLRIAPDHAEVSWTVTISEDRPMTVRGAGGDAQCAVRGSANDIYLALWNRGSTEPLRVEGDPEVLAMLRDNVKVRWG